MTATRVDLAAGDATATLAPDEGGLVLSLRVAGLELLVQRRTGTAPVPTFGSYLLAPWVGELGEGRLEFRGRRYELPRNNGRHAVHGLVTDGPWEVLEAGPGAARLTRTLGEPWPFGGRVTQQVRLEPDGITFEATIQADDAAMPAALGWHPWFACPDSSVVRVGVEAAEMLELDDELLPTGVIRNVAGDSDLRAAPVLGNRALDNVYVGARSPALLSLPGLELRVHFDPAIDVVVVYTSPGAVCIEPWSAWPDAARMAAAGHAAGLRELEPGESLRRWMRWHWRPTDRASH